MGLRRGPGVSRYYMYRRLSGVLNGLPPGGRALSISHSRRLCDLLGPGTVEVVEANYPDFDIPSLPFAADEFDYVVSDQVLQHIKGNPLAAIEETRRVLKPGGWAVHTTCCVSRVSRDPGDFWRFTPEGLAFLCRDFSRIIEVGGWGNPCFWGLDLLGMRYDPVPESRWHPLHWIATLNR